MFSFFRSWAKGNSSLLMLFSLLLSIICWRKENHWCTISKTNHKILHVHRSETRKFLSTDYTFIQHWRTENYVAIIEHLLTKINELSCFQSDSEKTLLLHIFYNTLWLANTTLSLRVPWSMNESVPQYPIPDS